MQYSIRDLLGVARGEKLCHLVVKNVRIVDVFGGRIVDGSIGIYKDIIVGIGEYKGEIEIDGNRGYVVPGFIDGHIHIESTMLTPVEFARIVGERGTQAVIADPHEIANVWGRQGIEFFLSMTTSLPVEIFFMAPSCVPATPLETSGGEISVEDIVLLYEKYPDRILGLGEVMNFPGVVKGDEDIWRKLEISRERVIDGHCPGLKGRSLNAYSLAGCRSDHECVTGEEVEEKLLRGLHIFARNGSAEKNLPQVLSAVNPYNAENFSLVTDDRHPWELLQKGHMDCNIREAISQGVSPIHAIKMATINPARYFGLKGRGAIAPGFKANFVIVSDLMDFKIQEVFLQGRSFREYEFPSSLPRFPSPSISIPSLTEGQLAINRGKDREKKIHVIGVVPGSIITENLLMNIEDACTAEEQSLLPRLDKDILKVVVVERHRGTGNVCVGLVKGFGIKKGAIASSVSHDSHNIIAIGARDADILLGINTLISSGGGMCVVNDGQIIAHLPLPVAGLMSDERAEVVAKKEKELNERVSSLGEVIPHPFMHLSFLALPVIPCLKITDKGLVDVNKFSHVPLII